MVMEIAPPEDNSALSLNEFISIVDGRHYNMNDRASLIDIAPELWRLSNNKTFLIELMLNELENCSEFQPRNLYGPSVFILHSCAEYFLRANIWKPTTAVEQSIKGFQYDVLHDHNFDILTVGYFGPGYKTRMYKYDASEVQGKLGERVNIIPAGEVTLYPGRMLLYMAKQDIHIQLPPRDLSISLNLIPRNDWIYKPQFQFDEEEKSICRYLHTSGTELVVRLIGLIGDDQAYAALEEIRKKHSSAHVRALAAVSQVTLDRKEKVRIRQGMEASDDAAQQFIFEQELKSPGSCLQPYRSNVPEAPVS